MQPVRAQVSLRPTGALDMAGLLTRDAPDGWRRRTLLSSRVQADDKWSQLSLDGALADSAGKFDIEQLHARGTYAPAPVGPFRLSFSGSIERQASNLVDSRTLHALESDISVAGERGGMWVGTAYEQYTRSDSNTALPLLRAGAWRRFGVLVLSVTRASHAVRLGGSPTRLTSFQYRDSTYNDTARVYSYFMRNGIRADSGSFSTMKHWSDFELGAGWSGGPLTLDGALGVRSAVASYARSVWTRASVTAQVGPQLALFAMGGNGLTQVALGLPASVRTFTLGLRVSPAAIFRPTTAAPIRTSAAAFAVRQAGPDAYLVSVRVPRARTVELSGDFAHWKPVSLEQTSADVWEVTLRVDPGTYRMNIRVDGDRWRAPPGVATIDDEFNGTVGVVVVR